MTAGQIVGRNGQSVLGSVSAAYVQVLLDTAAARGADRSRLAADAGLATRQLEDPAWRLDLDRLLQLFERAHRAAGDELIGLHMGMQVRPRTFSALGYAAMSCDTLGEAVALIPRYESLVYDGGSTVLSAVGGCARVAWCSGMPDGERMRPVNEAIVAGWLSFGRWITGIRGEMREACFQHRRPAGGAEYERLFGCPVRFEAEDNALSFDVGLLAIPLVQHDEQLRRLMEQQAREQLQQIHGTQLTPRVVAAIRQRLPQRAPTAAQIAQALDLSERSLRRHLQVEQVSFGELVIRVRRELALHYLAQPELGLSEITLLLGYGEQSSFTAAFKSWFGVPPGEYRQRCFATPPAL